MSNAYSVRFQLYFRYSLQAVFPLLFSCVEEGALRIRIRERMEDRTDIQATEFGWRLSFGGWMRLVRECFWPVAATFGGLPAHARGWVDYRGSTTHNRVHDFFVTRSNLL